MNKETYMKMVLALSYELFGSFDRVTADVLGKAVQKGLERMDQKRSPIAITELHLKKALSELLEYSDQIYDNTICDEILLACIEGCINRHELHEALGTSLIAYTLSTLIEAEYKICVIPNRIETLLYKHFPEFIKQQTEKRRAFKEYFNLIKKAKNNE